MECSSFTLNWEFILLVLRKNLFNLTFSCYNVKELSIDIKIFTIQLKLLGNI